MSPNQPDNSANTPAGDTSVGINTAGVTDWFVRNISGVAPPLSFELIPSGHSNLTYTITDSADKQYVLRRPPLTQVLATAHDMAREHRIISALHPANVPVPEPLGLCEDESVNDRPFYVMNYVDGVILGNSASARKFPPSLRRKASESMAKLLARLHSLSPEDVGLGELGLKENYIARQLRRWSKQLEQSKSKDRPVEIYKRMANILEALQGNIPDHSDATDAQAADKQAAGIVHGDYRLDNCILSSEGDVLAILDWELCTLGDVLADLAILLMYWTEPDDGFSPLADSPTQIPGFATRQEMLEIYQKTSGRNIPSMDYYMAFATWRLACILEGVYFRYQIGAMGTKELPGGAQNFGSRVEMLIRISEGHANNI